MKCAICKNKGFIEIQGYIKHCPDLAHYGDRTDPDLAAREIAVSQGYELDNQGRVINEKGE